MAGRRWKETADLKDSCPRARLQAAPASAASTLTGPLRQAMIEPMRVPHPALQGPGSARRPFLLALARTALGASALGTWPVQGARAAVAGPPRQASETRRLELQGHRGARGLVPESTLEGFARALEIGVDTLELDTGITSDGVVVVHHDRRLNPDHTRDADGRFIETPGALLHALRWSDLASLDVGRARPGSRTASQFPRQQPLDGARIPTLRQVLELALRAGPPGLQLNIETKLSPLAAQETLPPEPFVRLLLRDLREAGLLGRSTIQSFDWRTLREVQRQAPGVRTACLTSQQPQGPGLADGIWTAGLRLADHGSAPRMVKSAGAQVWSPFHGDVDAANIAEAQALGLRVAVWTVNDPRLMDRLIDLGVDALITDEPDRAREVMARRGLPLPPPGAARANEARGR